MIDLEIKSWTDWMEAWKDLVICPRCRGLFKGVECPHCQFVYEHTVEMRDVNGKMVELPVLTQMGAIDYATYSFLSLMQREWKRSVHKPLLPVYKNHDVPERMLVVILFWSLFEGLMDKFFTDSLRDVKESIAKDLLKRYNSIGSRLDQLYKMLFDVSFKDDLNSVGYGYIYDHLRYVQEKRNQFMHGDPEAIDEALITATIENLQQTQKAWIALYNLKCRRKVAEM